MTDAKDDDVMFRVLHTADWHLGKRFRGIFTADDATKLTRARGEVLDSIFGLAERHAVDAVLCAGDLFDNASPSPDWTKVVVDALEKKNWSNRPVFLLPGNHDPLLPSSVWARGSAFRSALPSWVHVVDTD